MLIDVILLRVFAPNVTMLTDIMLSVLCQNCHYAECSYAMCNYVNWHFTVCLYAEYFVPSVIVLTDIMPSVFMLSVLYLMTIC
jgi:hypothetical protein